jgi:uncharacterized protein YjbI with pentapeptide repeats
MDSDGQNPGGILKTPPATIAPGAPAETPLPAIAAKADDLEEIKKAVEDAASVSGGLWLSYLFVLSYVAIAAGAVTHEDLLLIRPVKLPFLNVELPLKAFFALAPFVVLIIHAYALMHFIMLGKKASRFHNELRRQFPAEGDSKDIRDKLRRLLPSNIFVQILAGPPELRGGIFGFFLKGIALTTLVAFPVLVLLLLQIQFLPFHDVAITWAQRSALSLDVVVLWLLRPPIIADLSVESSQRARFLSQERRGFGLVRACIMSIVAIWFSIVVATIPGEWQETVLASLNPPVWRVVADSEETEPITTRDLLFAGEVDETTRRRASSFSNTLVLPGFNIYEALKIADPEQVAWKEHLLDLRGRHLEQAVLNGANLTKADLTGAQLQGASLLSALLQDASLYSAQLQGARLDFAWLQHAGLSRAQLQRASLFHAMLRVAWLDGAQLQGSRLDDAQLQGAWLRGAQLQGASLNRAQLQGAWLRGAQLQGASLNRAQLQGASLDMAQMQGATLSWAQLQGVSLEGAQLQGATIDRAQLQGASLGGAQLQGASLDQAELQGAWLDGARLQGASLDQAELQGASLDGAAVNATGFSYAFLWRTSWGEIDRTKLGAVLFRDATWKPVSRGTRPGDPPLPWDAKAYEELRAPINGLPEGARRDAAVKGIERLDCSHPDKTLASCDPAAAPPPELLDLQKKLAAASVDDAAFAKALAKELRILVCESDSNAIFILRGIMRSLTVRPSSRLEATGREAPELIEFIMSKDCPVSASLTEDDKAKLLKIKQAAEKNFPPQAASKNGK